MQVRVGAPERDAFRTCRRRWDFSSPNRRNLTPQEATPGFDLSRALLDALAVYYFPGMWDWPRGIVQPLVRKATHRDLDEDAARCRPSWDGDELLRSRADLGARGGVLLDRYAVWASTTDRFAHDDVTELVPTS
ncbi:MAG: hypothetical protein ACRD0B_12520 [Acidimicrobiales bacterium]